MTQALENCGTSKSPMFSFTQMCTPAYINPFSATTPTRPPQRFTRVIFSRTSLSAFLKNPYFNSVLKAKRDLTKQTIAYIMKEQSLF